MKDPPFGSVPGNGDSPRPGGRIRDQHPRQPNIDMYGGLARSASPDFATIDPPSSPSRLADKDGWESSRGIVLEVSFTRLT